ncbi:unnamed protein product [Urochloa humidicola]
MEAARVPAAGAPRLGSAASPARARRLVLPGRGVVATNRWPAVTDGRPASRAPATVLQLARAGDARADQGRRGQHGTSVERGLQLTESRAQGVAELARRGLTHPVQRRGAARDARPIVHARPGGAARSVRTCGAVRPTRLQFPTSAALPDGTAHLARCGPARSDWHRGAARRCTAGRSGTPGAVGPMGPHQQRVAVRFGGVLPGRASLPGKSGVVRLSSEMGRELSSTFRTLLFFFKKK